MDIHWNIIGLMNRSLDDGSSDLVQWIMYRCLVNHHDPDGNPYQSVAEGQVFEINADSSVFVPYADLTEETLLSWVWNSGVNKTEIEQRLIDDINAQILNPKPIVSLPPVELTAEEIQAMEEEYARRIASRKARAQ